MDESDKSWVGLHEVGDALRGYSGMVRGACIVVGPTVGDMSVEGDGGEAKVRSYVEGDSGMVEGLGLRRGTRVGDDVVIVGDSSG